MIGISAVLGSVITVLRRKTMAIMDPWRYELVAGMVHLLLAPVYYAVLAADPEKYGQPMSEMIPGALWVVLITALNAVCTVAFLWSLKGDADVGVVSTLAGLSPVITVMFSAMFLGEVPSWRQAIGIGLVLVGSIVAAGQ